MSKKNRGAGLMNVPYKGRGTCPICQATGIKLLYALKGQDQSLKVCKRCQNKKENLKV